MPTTSFSFFAALDDMIEPLTVLQTDMSLTYYPAGRLGSASDLVALESATEIDGIGTASFGDQAREPAWMLVPAHAAPIVRAVRQSKGGVSRFIDQRLNPTSLTIRPGGYLPADRGGPAVIAGQAGTLSDDSWSLRGMRALEKIVGSRWEKVKSFYIGPEAAALWNEGARLTTDVRSPTLYDLRA